MSKTGAWVIAEQEKAALANPLPNGDFEMDVAIASLRRIANGGDATAISRGALAMIYPNVYPAWRPEAEMLGTKLFSEKNDRLLQSIDRMSKDPWAMTVRREYTDLDF